MRDEIQGGAYSAVGTVVFGEWVEQLAENPGTPISRCTQPSPAFEVPY